MCGDPPTRIYDAAVLPNFISNQTCQPSRVGHQPAQQQSFSPRQIPYASAYQRIQRYRHLINQQHTQPSVLQRSFNTDSKRPQSSGSSTSYLYRRRISSDRLTHVYQHQLHATHRSDNHSRIAHQHSQAYRQYVSQNTQQHSIRAQTCSSPSYLSSLSSQDYTCTNACSNRPQPHHPSCSIVHPLHVKTLSKLHAPTHAPRLRSTLLTQPSGRYSSRHISQCSYSTKYRVRRQSRHRSLSRGHNIRRSIRNAFAAPYILPVAYKTIIESEINVSAYNSTTTDNSRIQPAMSAIYTSTTSTRSPCTDVTAYASQKARTSYSSPSENKRSYTEQPVTPPTSPSTPGSIATRSAYSLTQTPTLYDQPAQKRYEATLPTANSSTTLPTVVMGMASTLSPKQPDPVVTSWFSKLRQSDIWPQQRHKPYEHKPAAHEKKHHSLPSWRRGPLSARYCCWIFLQASSMVLSITVGSLLFPAYNELQEQAQSYGYSITISYIAYGLVVSLLSSSFSGFTISTFFWRLPEILCKCLVGTELVMALLWLVVAFLLLGPVEDPASPRLFVCGEMHRQTDICIQLTTSYVLSFLCAALQTALFSDNFLQMRQQRHRVIMN